MSQETGIFSVRRPRETLGNINQNVSAIPLPASAMKRSNSSSNIYQAPSTSNHARSVSGSRMSLAPGRPSQPVFQRSSSGGNLADMGASTIQRPSSANMMGASSGRKSMAPFQTPAHASSLQLQQSTQRRSSVYSARNSGQPGSFGRQSFFQQAPVPAGVPKDPRPLRDRNYQKQLGQELMDFLTQNNFEMDMKHSLSHNSMVSPTQKDFNYMFQWLYLRIDPSYRFYKNIDQEVPPILKQLRYPYEKSITKSQISAVGGANWGTFLGVLHWMMQLVKMMEQFNAGSYDESAAEAGFDVQSDRIVFEFLTDSYHKWLAMEDDQEDKAEEILQPHVQKMVQRFDQANSKYLEQVKMLEAEHQALSRQVEELSKSEQRIRKLEEQTKDYEDDKNKFDAYNGKLQVKIEKYYGRVQPLDEEMQRIDDELQRSEQQRKDLQDALDRQGITMDEIDKMNTERERLQSGVDATTQRLDEVKRKVNSRETETDQKLDAAERAVQDYNTLGYEIGEFAGSSENILGKLRADMPALGMIPKTAANAKGEDFELFLKVNAGPDFRSSRSKRSESPEQERLLADAQVQNGYRPQNLLNIDVKGKVKSSIVNLRKEVSERKNAAAEQDMSNRDLLDKIREAIEDKQQEVDGLGHKVRAAEEECERTRQMTNAQRMNSEAQIERLEKELSNMRTTLGESVQLMEQREMNTNLEYEQLQIRATALREELHTEVERILNDVIKFKVHIQQNLEEYDFFVEEEVQKECEGGDIKQDDLADEVKEQ
ncbi:MAG: hypothetical protein Q9162_004223 [Coniocarpon cinnabarinum]